MCDGNEDSGNEVGEMSCDLKKFGEAKPERGFPEQEAAEGAPMSAPTVASGLASAGASRVVSTSQYLVGRPSIDRSCSPSKYCRTSILLQLDRDSCSLGRRLTPV